MRVQSRDGGGSVFLFFSNRVGCVASLAISVLATLFLFAACNGMHFAH